MVQKYSRKGYIMKNYVVDVFTEERFRGNPAGVCKNDEWLPEEPFYAGTWETGLKSAEQPLRI